jgi:hypothetical protein
MVVISKQVTPQGNRPTVVKQDFVFFIGPSPENRLDTIADYGRRVEDVKPFLANGGERHNELLAAASRAYGVTIKTLATSLSQGGMRDVSCPNLRLDLVASETDDGTPLVAISNGHNGDALCRWLIRLLNAEWVDLWWMGTLGYAQLKCDRDVHIGPTGSKRWDS